MFNTMVAIIGILLTIFFVVGTHEFAHFATARLLGVKVLRFSIGFGKKLLSWTDKSGTEYVIAAIPLGGYVKMLDEGEGDVAEHEKHRAYNQQPFYKKFLIVLAGPLMNFACAIILYWIIFMIGFVTIMPIIGQIKPNSIAAEGGLKSQQKILEIDNQPTQTWTAIMFRLIAHIGDQDYIHVQVKNPNNNTIENRMLNLANWHMNELTPDPLSSLGIAPYTPPIPLIIGHVKTNSPAENAGLKVGDKLIAYNAKPIKDWLSLVTAINKSPDEKAVFTVDRNQQRLTIPVTIGHQYNLFLQKSGVMGISPNFKWPPELLTKIKLPALPALARAYREVADLTYFNFLLFGKLLTGKLSLQSLGGPITIFESAGSALNSGLLAFLGFLAFLSIAVGAINIIPIPGLDGGHLLIQTIEFITRKPISVAVLNLLYRFGFLVIFLLLVQAFINDILRLG